MINFAQKCLKLNEKRDGFIWGETVLERNRYNKKALEIVVPDMPITESTKNILDDLKTEAEAINIEVWYVIAK